MRVCQLNSVWQALMLTYLASQGVMKEALEDVLGLKDLGKKHASLAFKDLKHFDEVVLGGKESSPGRGLSLLQDQTQGKDQGKQYELNSANRIYIESSMRRFMDQETLRFLHDEIKMLDFGKEPEESRKKINSWVSQITKGKIEELLPAGHVDRSTLMALVRILPHATLQVLPHATWGLFLVSAKLNLSQNLT
ncbi:unnamed protein product [Darwinula stevensoni]|uniref:Serpin domain-containing protein n=1 Tax=Darwinula stevensoni TaxID=69355 RepID=A0A7R9A519_9CRUS|nr:unnamed protein product [Darwinula stevensoni]CAG0885494.1 unnamed protein product [Darwinula stevensoni]